MSFRIPKKLLDDDWKDYIKKECNISQRADQWNKNPGIIPIFKVDKSTDVVKVVLPLALWKTALDEFPNKNKYDIVDAKFIGEPVENEKKDQITVLKEITEKLKTDHYALMALRTGFGKTFCSLYLICNFIKLKTVLLIYNRQLDDQWIKEGQKFCPDLKIQVVKKKFDPNADVYIVGILKLKSYNESELGRIGAVIVDEVHLCMTQTFSDALLKFSPLYLLGLSATFDRKDGMHKLLYPFFGNKKEFISRHQVKNFKVVKYVTGIVPEVNNNMNGTLNWSGLVRSLACNNDRQQIVVDLCERHPDKTVLILCKRVCTILGCENYLKCPCKDKISKGLIPALNDLKESVDYVAFTKKKYDQDARILIGTFDKLGVGFDSNREILILESDVIDVRQNEGRTRIENNLIYDLVDNFSTLEKHWNGRKKWFIKRGATIEIEK